MKTGEMFTYALAKPNAKFNRLSLNNAIYFFEGGRLKFRGSNRDEDSNAFPLLDEDWELVREPVPWNKALQAWIAGRNVSYKINKDIFHLDSTNHFLRPREIDRPLTRDELSRCEWYIDD